MLSSSDISQLAEQLVSHQLSPSQAQTLLSDVTPEKITPAGFAAFVSVVRQVLSHEYADFAQLASNSFDCCGTGGSGLPHFNTSTTVAFVVASAGVQVAKFGNRKATGLSGSFDLLAELGFPAQISAAAARQVMEETGLVFLFAPACYPALAQLSAARQALGKRTVFNYIGPLLNPAMPTRRLIGVSDLNMQECIAHSLCIEGTIEKALVVRSANNVDELEPGSLNHMLHIEGSNKSALQQDFAQFAAPGDSLSGGNQHLTPARNKELFEQIIGGIDRRSPYAALVRVNAGAALFAAGKAASLESGHDLAASLLADGTVQQQFNKVRAAYARHS